jgi:hypothetical protein
MLMVAFLMGTYKAPHDFVFFGRDGNDNNNENPSVGAARAEGLPEPGPGRDGVP